MQPTNIVPIKHVASTTRPSKHLQPKPTIILTTQKVANDSFPRLSDPIMILMGKGDGYQGQGDKAMRRSEPEMAKRCFQKAAGLYIEANGISPSLQVSLKLGLILKKMQYHQAAINAFKQIPSTQISPLAYKTMTECYPELGNHDEVKRVALKQNPARPALKETKRAREGTSQTSPPKRLKRELPKSEISFNKGTASVRVCLQNSIG